MISVQNLSYKYPSADIQALSTVDFNIERGEIFGFLGPNGSGKTTTQKVLFKLLTGYDGQAQIDGVEARDWDESLYQRIGVSFELPNHYLKLTALENLNFFGAFYPRQLDPLEVLEMVDLKEDANRRVADFSKGMKMRLNFARSFLHDPEVLFLDEPTSGLDPVNAKTVKNIILELKSRGKTIFLTTHQMYDADELCDRVAFIVEGHIKACDAPKNLKLKYGKSSVEVQLAHGSGKSVFDIQDLGNNVEFLAFIKSAEVETIHSKEASLDDIFLSVTGKSLV